MSEQLHFGHMLIGSGTCTSWYTPFKLPFILLLCIIGFLIWLYTLYDPESLLGIIRKDTLLPIPLFSLSYVTCLCVIFAHLPFHIPTIACLILFKRFLLQISPSSFCMFLINHINQHLPNSPPQLFPTASGTFTKSLQKVQGLHAFILNVKLNQIINESMPYIPNNDQGLHSTTLHTLNYVFVHDKECVSYSNAPCLPIASRKCCQNGPLREVFFT